MFKTVKSRISNILSPILEQKEIENPDIADKTQSTQKVCKRQFDNQETCLQTPPDKRRRTSQASNRSPFNFLLKWRFGSLFSYVMKGKERSEIMPRPSLNSFSHGTSRTIATANERYTTMKRKDSRLPLSQISNSTTLDLTRIDDDSDEDEVKVTQVTLDLTKSEKHIFEHGRSQCLGPLSGQKSVGYVDETVRLDERRRYRELLAQFTTVALPDYANSISPSSTSHTKSNPISIDTLSTTSWLQKRLTTKPIQIDLTKEPQKTTKPRRRFYHEILQQSKSSSSILEYSCLEDVSVSSHTVSKNIKKSELTESRRVQEKILLDTDWIKKWRETLDPIQLERERRIEIEERKKEAIKKRRREDFENLQKKLEEESKTNEFPELTNEMLTKVKNVLSRGRPTDVFAQGFNAEITRSDLGTLRDSTWLNDEVVNFYFNLLKERSEKEKDILKVHVFNTFFYPKISKTGHAGVKRWTRKLDIFAVDMILIPIHLGMHWCLAVIDFRNKQIAYYDSLKGNNMQCIVALKKYLQDESMDKKKTSFSFDGWSEIMPKDIPEQMNGCDCGVFMCKYAEYKSRNVKFTFTQAHMPYFRERMIYEIINKKLM